MTTSSIIIVLASCLITVSAIILIFGLFPIRQVIKQLPEGVARRNWYILDLLIKLFIFGYLGYLTLLWQHAVEWHDLIVPVIFFLGACFVWMTTTLSLQTAKDIRRVFQLEQENITDPLTCIFNRRYIDRRLKEEMDRALRYETPFSVLMIDIDHFKRVNDTYGHQTGDMVLCYLAKLLKKSMRTSDIIARYGGEEFLIIAPATELGVAGELAVRLQNFIKYQSITIGDESEQILDIHLSVSIGVAESRQVVNCQDDIVAIADQALYKAKHTGRNRVVIASSPEQTASCATPVCAQP
jgi:diguanylate cyclase (GGDEF)-like protein